MRQEDRRRRRPFFDGCLKWSIGLCRLVAANGPNVSDRCGPPVVRLVVNNATRSTCHVLPLFRQNNDHHHNRHNQNTVKGNERLG
jgi:hypothetical protein